VKRDDPARLRDILAAIEAIETYAARGLDDGLVFDAVRMRLIEIGEAVKDLSPETLALEPDLPWREIAGMRDVLAHHYFDTSDSIVAATVRDDVPLIRAAVERRLT
jgi:uncharacterized protein with HEPN domain